MSFAYDILSSNNYSDEDILNLAKNYIPDSISLSDDRLLKIIQKYKNEYTSNDLSAFQVELNNDVSNNPQEKSKEEDSIYLTSDNLTTNSNFEEESKLDNKNKVLDYFERVNRASKY